jgi:hypothetical protein
MAVDAPPETRAAVGLDDDRLEHVRREMLAGRMEKATHYLPDALVDRYAIAGSPAECVTAIAALRPHFDLFMLPLNDEARAEDHIRISAGILRLAGDAPLPLSSSQ